MRCLYAIVLVSLLGGVACAAEQPCPSGVRVDGVCAHSNAARVTSLSATRPAELALVLDWPIDGIRDDGGAVLLLGAYRTEVGQLRLWGGHGTNVAGDTNVLRAEDSFDVAVLESDVDTRTEPFTLWIPLASKELLGVEDAVLDDLELALEPGGVVVPVSGRLRGISDMVDQATSPPDFDSDGDGIEDRWRIETGFEATPAWML